MAKISDRPSYSYRSDPTVAEFPDDGPITFMDGDCALCTFGARTISRLDRKGEFRICPRQSPLGQAVLRHYGIDPDDPESWLYLVDGRAYTSLDAMIRVGRRLGGIGNGLRVLSVLPRGVQDWIYRRISRNRYAILGRADMCGVPDPGLRQRLIR